MTEQIICCNYCRTNIPDEKLNKGFIFCDVCKSNLSQCHNCKENLMMGNKCLSCKFTKSSLKCNGCEKMKNDGMMVNGYFQCVECIEKLDYCNPKYCPKCKKFTVEVKDDVKEIGIIAGGDSWVTVTNSCQCGYSFSYNYENL